MTDRECEDLLGDGTRSVAGQALGWRDPDGMVLACQAAMIVRDPKELILVWTLCSINVPTLQCIDEKVTCPECRHVLSEGQ